MPPPTAVLASYAIETEPHLSVTQPLSRGMSSSGGWYTNKRLNDLSHHSKALLTMIADFLNHIYLFANDGMGDRSQSWYIPGHP